MGKRYKYEEDGVKSQEDRDRGWLSAVLIIAVLLGLVAAFIYLW